MRATCPLIYIQTKTTANCIVTVLGTPMPMHVSVVQVQLVELCMQVASKREHRAVVDQV